MTLYNSLLDSSNTIKAHTSVVPERELNDSIRTNEKT